MDNKSNSSSVRRDVLLVKIRQVTKLDKLIFNNIQLNLT